MPTAKGAPQRHRKLFPAFVLMVLTYGRHSTVQWQDQWTCNVDAWKFANTLGTNTTHLRRSLDWLKKHRYLTALDWGYGWIKLTVRPPLERRIEEEQT